MKWRTYRVGIGYAGGFAVFDDARAVPEAEEEGGRGGEEDIASGRVSVEDKNTQESWRHVFWSRGERKGIHDGKHVPVLRSDGDGRHCEVC